MAEITWKCCLVLSCLWLFVPVLAGDPPAGSVQLQRVNRPYLGIHRFFAKSQLEIKSFGGWAPSENEARPLQPDESFAPGEVSLTVFPQPTKSLYGVFSGFEVILANETGEDVIFRAIDSHLFIVREALDPDGEWRPIEVLRPTDCGNSYHDVGLHSGFYWSFIEPEYQGSFSTRMRFVLKDKRLSVVYSNEFVGEIEPTQFKKAPWWMELDREDYFVERMLQEYQPVPPEDLTHGLDETEHRNIRSQDLARWLIESDQEDP